MARGIAGQPNVERAANDIISIIPAKIRFGEITPWEDIQNQFLQKGYYEAETPGYVTLTQTGFQGSKTFDI
jgi:hypothetical protein